MSVVSKAERTAIHEAGHVVLMFELGLPFAQVTTVPTNGKLGSTQPTPLVRIQSGRFAPKRWRDSVHRERVYNEYCIMGLFGGQIAEVLILGDYHAPGCSGDTVAIHKHAFEVLKRIEPRTPYSAPEEKALVNWLYLRAWELLSQQEYMAAITVLATALFPPATLSYSDAQECINRSKADEDDVSGVDAEIPSDVVDAGEERDVEGVPTTGSQPEATDTSATVEGSEER